jgi:hypothetical protein
MITSINSNDKFEIQTGEVITVEKMDLLVDIGILVHWSIGKSDTIFIDGYADAVKFLNEEKAISIK